MKEYLHFVEFYLKLICRFAFFLIWHDDGHVGRYLTEW